MFLLNSLDENLGVSANVRRSLESVKRIRVNPPKSGHAYPALSDIESSGAERNTPDNYTPEPPYTDDDNEHSIMDRYMYSSQDERDDEEDRYKFYIIFLNHLKNRKLRFFGKMFKLRPEKMTQFLMK